MKKCSTPPYLSAATWLSIVAIVFYILFTGFNLNEILSALNILLIPILLLLVALPALILGVYYLRKAILGKKTQRHIRFF